MNLKIKKWNIEEETGYKPITTFWEDFSIADMFGLDAITDTYNRAFNEWKDNYKYLTELVMVLNHKTWEHYKTNEDYGRLYNELWTKADEYALNNLKEEQVSYYYDITD